MAEKLDHGGVPASDDDGEPYRDHPNFSDLFPSNFSKGLRVLVFDEDPKYLQLLQRHLQEFQYQVTTCNEESKAMRLLRNHRSRFEFDIAMIQVNNSDGDIFRFISEFGLKMDLSIIIISKDDSVQSVIKWMRNGASDYLIKPIRPEDLRIIFKHVVKKIGGRRSVVTLEAGEKAAGEKSSSVGDSNIRNPNKRKISTCLNAEVNEKDHHDQDRACAYSSKNKRRIVWDHKLHKKFVDAVNCLGTDKAVPKKIVEIMNVEYISRENVASHLQKYRINLKKKNDKIEREKMNQSFITQQEGNASNFYRGINVQFPTHYINNIHQPSYMHQQITYHNNITTHQHHQTTYPNNVTAHQHHQTTYPNNVTAHQYHHHHQTSDFTLAENFGFNNFIVEDSMVANTWPTLEVFPFQEPASFPMRNDHEAGPSSMFHLPSISSDHRHSSFLDQLGSGGFDYNSDCSDPETD